MQQIVRKLKTQGRSIGFVPTMGYLHEGHLSLMRSAKVSTDVTIVSIFVNPAQFAPNEDFSRYPRDIERDERLLKAEQTDYLFLPEPAEIYQPGYQTYVSVEKITRFQEGEFRPEHFKGVTTVVSILFNIVQPDKAFFGQKDAQQAETIRRMNADLKFGIEIVVCPIIREQDGLAMSSRNVYLSKQERQAALILNQSLNLASELIENGERSTDNVIIKVKELISTESLVIPDYIRIVARDDFSETKLLKEGSEYYVLVAAMVGKTRLIDNVYVNL